MAVPAPRLWSVPAGSSPWWSWTRQPPPASGKFFLCLGNGAFGQSPVALDAIAAPEKRRLLSLRHLGDRRPQGTAPSSAPSLSHTRPGDPTNRPLFDTSWSPALRAPQPPRARFGDPVLHARLRRGAVPAARPSASLSPASGRLQWPPELTAQAARERAPRLPRRDCPALASRGPLHPRFPQAALRALLRPRERCSVINPG